MADAVLSVELVGKLDALRDTFNKARTETSNFSRDTNKKLNEVDRGFEQLANDIDKSLKQGAASAKTASNSISKDLAKAAQISASSGQAIAGGSNRAAFALTNLGRVAQDAPFGFIGIQNNLNPLLESFQQLQKETGSTVASFKALGASLLGPAGIGIALSVVGAAILFYQQYQQRANKETKEAVDENKKYVESLSALNRARLDGSQNALKETTTLQALYNASQNATLSTQERIKAATLLQQTYPKTFDNFTKEEILLGKSKGAYDELTRSIIAQATVKAASEKLADQSIKRLEIEGRLIEVNTAKRKLQAEEERANARLRSGDPNNARFVANEIVNIQDKINEKRQEEKGILEEINKSRGEEAQLTSFIQRQIESQGVAVLGMDNNLKQVADKYSRINTEALDINKTLEEENKLREEGLKKITAYLAKLSGADGANASAMSGRVVAVPLEFQFTPTAVASASELLQEQFQEEFGDKFQKNINQLLNNTLGNAFGDSFSALGEALAKGGNPIESFGQSVIQGFGSFLSEFGGLLIKYGIAATAYGKLQAALLTPGGAIIAGPLAIAAGLALKIASGAISGFVSGQGSQQSGYQIPKFADGVTNFSGGLAMVGERGPELVTLPTGSNVITNENVGRLARNNGGGTQKIEVYGEISGDKINLVSSRSARKTNRIT